jgi:RNA polymerase sigma-70 factor (ECF subfamily)
VSIAQTAPTTQHKPGLNALALNGYSPPTPSEYEALMVERAQRGDEDAFAWIYKRYWSPIYNFVYRMMGSPHDAEDLATDAFVKAWLYLPRTKPDLKVQAWLYRVATNVCIDELRHRRVVSWKSWAEYTGVFDPSQVAPDDPAREARDAETRREVREVFGAVRGHYDGSRRCGERAQTALLLREWGDLTYTEIAAVLGTTRAAVKSLLFRARVAFREIWEARHAA